MTDMKLPMNLPIVGATSPQQDQQRQIMQRRSDLMESKGLSAITDILDSIIDGDWSDADLEFLERTTDPRLMFERRQHRELMNQLHAIYEAIHAQAPPSSDSSPRADSSAQTSAQTEAPEEGEWR